eukprot:11687016-Ditylum_brightwellii.AAC.1
MAMMVVQTIVQMELRSLPLFQLYRNCNGKLIDNSVQPNQFHYISKLKCFTYYHRLSNFQQSVTHRPTKQKE